MRNSKFKNIKIHNKYGDFDSKKEYFMWLKLKKQEENGEIFNLKRQVPIPLIEKSKWGTTIKYIADFMYQDKKSKMLIVADCKSDATITPVFKLKARLFAEKYGFEIKILK